MNANEFAQRLRQMPAVVRLLGPTNALGFYKEAVQSVEKIIEAYDRQEDEIERSTNEAVACLSEKIDHEYFRQAPEDAARAIVKGLLAANNLPGQAILGSAMITIPSGRQVDAQDFAHAWEEAHPGHDLGLYEWTVSEAAASWGVSDQMARLHIKSLEWGRQRIIAGRLTWCIPAGTPKPDDKRKKRSE